MHTLGRRPPPPLLAWFGTKHVPDFVLALEAAGGEVFVVGGAVRDWVMGRVPGDVDLLVRELAPERVHQTLAPFGMVALVGERFGVFTCKMQRTGRTYEVALPRTDHAFGTGGYRDVTAQVDVHLPLASDMQRRDFTMNALAYRITTKELFDFFGGEKDITARCVRAVGDPQKRFAEDYTRMLRALRFATTLEFSFEKKTGSALKKCMPHLADKRGHQWVVAREMLARELTAALCASPVHAFLLAQEFGVWKALACSFSPQQSRATQRMLALLSSKEFFSRFSSWSGELVWAVMLLQLSLVQRKKMLVAIPIANAGVSSEHVLQLIERAEMLLKKEVPTPSILEQYFFLDPILGHTLRALLWIMAEGSSAQEKRSVHTRVKKIEDLLASFPRQRDGVRLVASLLNGHDIKAALPLVSGQRIGTLLALVRDSQLSGRISTKAQARKLLTI